MGTDDMSIELKPCPFCGSRQVGKMLRKTRYGYIAFVSCDICSAQTKVVNVAPKYIDDDGDPDWDAEPFLKVDFLWNMRNKPID